LPRTEKKSILAIAASFQSSSSKCSKGHQILLESSETQSIVSRHLAVKHVLFSPKNFETKSVASRHSTASKSSKAEPSSERKEGDDAPEVSKTSKAKSVVSKYIETESISSSQSVISKSSKVEPNELKGDDDASVVSKNSRAKSVVSKSDEIGPAASENSKTASQITDVK
jgi:hypothetical protein